MNKEYSIILGPKEIAGILPHRYPFLLVDRIIYLNVEEGEIVGLKNVTMNEAFFQGHFPGVPIMPGVLVLEALAQTGGILVHQKGYQNKIALLLSVANAKFRRPIVPGDAVHLHAKGIYVSNKGGKIQARALVENRIVTEAELSFALVEKNQL
jgi:3-hydroxyacyl-[acyl-carrier-protein] dehydratase